MQTGEFALPTPPAFPALARGEALRDIPTPPFVPALTLGEAVSEAIREAAYEIGAYGPADAGETGVE